MNRFLLQIWNTFYSENTPLLSRSLQHIKQVQGTEERSTAQLCSFAHSCSNVLVFLRSWNCQQVAPNFQSDQSAIFTSYFPLCNISYYTLPWWYWCGLGLNCSEIQEECFWTIFLWVLKLQHFKAVQCLLFYICLPKPSTPSYYSAVTDLILNCANN